MKSKIDEYLWTEEEIKDAEGKVPSGCSCVFVETCVCVCGGGVSKMSGTETFRLLK